MGFLELLIQKNIITPQHLSVAQKEASSSDETLEEALQKQGVSKMDILTAKEEFYKVPSRDVPKERVPFEVLNYIPEQSARHYQFLPLSVTDGVLEVGIVDPDNLEARDALQFISSKINLPYKLFVVTEDDFNYGIEGYRGLSGEVTKALTELETELSVDEALTSLSSDDADVIQEGKTGSDAKTIIEDAPVTKIVATILRYAIEGGASDIHIEPLDTEVRVRFRVDGIMRTSLMLPIKVHQAVVSRIKILSNMKLDEKRKPQDNRFSAHLSGRKIDFRVSTFPTYYGEKVVMRVLDSEKGVIPLDDMGLSERNIKAIRHAIKKPYGLVLISGPTGSGKTTTLYSMLSEIDRDTKNVLSLEDPVEYNIPGISQSQVRPEIGYTFATGLRTTLRQDPDVIMVGEIRDKETAGLAIQAALTGHLVLSTIHTNNAVGVIPRLIDMGVDPYLIAPTLVLAIAQRLVRKRCAEAGKEVAVTGSLKAQFEQQFSTLPPRYRKDITLGEKIYEIQPSPECPSGTRGRVAVMEVLEMNTEIERVILGNASEETIMEAARKMGMLTMKEDAILKAFEGTIPYEEVNTLGGLYDETQNPEEYIEKMEEKEMVKE
jgi:type IV pilus assembly protein PilB